jgi:branched-chain amino acid transport system substrate-binding protein
VDDPEDPTGPPSDDGGPITLAASVAESGRHSLEGTEVARGYRLAVEILNEKGGIRGRPVQLEIRDDGSDAQASARLHAGFIAAGTVDGLLGPYSSTITDAVLAVTEVAGVPMVAPMAATPAVWSERQRQWSVQFLTPGPTYLQGSVEVAVFGGARTVAVVYENSSFPASVVEGVRGAVRRHGLEIVLDRSYEVGAADHEAIAAAARDAGADLFIGGGYTADAIGFAAAASAVRYRPILMSLLLGPGQPQFAEAVGQAARCVAGNAPWHPAIQTAGFIADNETFVGRYEAAHGKTPGYHAAGGFAAVELMAEGLDRAISGTGGPDRAALRDFLFSARTETIVGPYEVAPIDDADAGAQRGLKGLQVQWQDDGAGGLALRIVHPWAAANATPCYMN